MELAKVQDKIVELGQKMRAISERAAKEDRLSLTAEERAEFDKIDTERKEYQETESRLRALDESEKRLAESTGRKTEHVQPTTEQRTVEQRGTRRTATVSRFEQVEGLRSWLLAGSDVVRTAEHQARAQKVGLNLDHRQMHIMLPQMALRSLRRIDQEEWSEEQRALSTLNTGSPVDGYYTISAEMLRPLEVALLAFGGMRVRSTILRTDTGASLPIPTVNDTGNKGEILAENTIVNQQDVSFNQLTLDAYKYSSKMILVSVELLQDNAINLPEFLGRALGERIGRITNDHFTTGTGSSQPKGLLAATTASGVQLAAQTPTYAEMVSIQHSVDPAYRVNGAWMFSDSMLAEIKKIVDASTGRPIWMPTMIGSEPDTILGDPYVINQSMAAAAGSGAGKSIAYGDLSKYIVRDVRQITLLRLDERFADYHQVAFLAFSRHDGDLLDAGTHPVKHALNKA